MTHQHHKEQENYDKIYYIVGLLSGLFAGFVINNGIIFTLIMGVFGVLYTAVFLQLLVKGRENA